jgi:IS30 family transposase
MEHRQVRRVARLQYRASTAQWKAERQAKRPKPAKLTVNERLRTYVQDRLAGWVEAPGGGLRPWLLAMTLTL